MKLKKSHPQIRNLYKKKKKNVVVIAKDFFNCM